VQYQSPVGRLEWLTSFRGLAALYVVLSHAYQTVKFSPHNTFESIVWHFTHGTRGVPTFMVLSGFALALSVRKNDWRLKTGYAEYLLIRWKRLAPAFYFAIVVTTILVLTLVNQKTGTQWDKSVDINVWDPIRHALFIGELGSRHAKLNHVFYSMGIEFKLSLLFPLFILMLRRRGPYAALGVAALVSLATLVIPALVERGYPTFIASFAGGIVACYATERPAGNRPLLLALALFFGIGSIAFNHELGHHGSEGVWGLSMCLTLYLLTVTPGVSKFLQQKPIIALGGISYSLYLIHAPILQMVYQGVGGWSHVETIEGSLLFAAVALPCSILGAVTFQFASKRLFGFVDRVIPTEGVVKRRLTATFHIGKRESTVQQQQLVFARQSDVVESHIIRADRHIDPQVEASLKHGMKLGVRLKRPRTKVGSRADLKALASTSDGHQERAMRQRNLDPVADPVDQR
jgi:peptidoglycan/LPS O-acetylase OafA/YrhL